MNPQKTYSLDEAQKKLEFYCAYQERCHKEVVNKLTTMRMIPDAIDVIVVHLIQNNFLNEERFAKAFVLGKFRIKKWGKNRLQLELKRKDISKTIIGIALQEIEEADYLETFHALAEKKLETIRESNSYKKKKKLADYLLYRGWESALVYDKVNALIQ
ncbi:regulatory protein RecX [Oceanihabitans sp. 2_MG-2023]|uniref:regulatory protein RecX n=1 Tax=Oceanihabitans sp. 2_MG-2023 TaxID=3062661 RepID=UPI0026E349F2|nr:regulatory protein RecX [Oceanihabitans sp. 2_MG-2023]MDO6595683.1 regulatory protein RecX [Oceanihabitans sp. 2_MG-2023]